MTAKRCREMFLASVALASGVGCGQSLHEETASPSPARAAPAVQRQATVAAARARGSSAVARTRATGMDAPFLGRSALARGHTQAKALGSAKQTASPLGDLWNPPAPQVLAVFGEVLAAPKLVPVFYGNDPMMPQLLDMEQRLGGSAYWAPTAEYGVAAATVLAPIVLTASPPARLSNAEVDALAANLAASGPAPDPDSIYVLHFAASTTITLNGGTWESCKQFGAYHASTFLPSGQQVAYAVIPRCDGYLGFHGLDDVTYAISHEVVEAATDPFGNGYIDTDWQASGWAVAFEGGLGAELGDFCEFQTDPSTRDPSVGGYLVQRYYSNKSARAWHDPCVPAPNRAYFNAQPIVTGTSVGTFTWAKGVSIAPGARVTVPVKLFSDTPTGDWQLSAEEEVNPHLPPPSGELSFSFDVPHGKNGDVRFLTITRKALAAGEIARVLPFAIVSTLGTTKNVWWVVVGQ